MHFYCPICKRSLDSSAESYTCKECQRIYPLTDDIPDFRIDADDSKSQFYRDLSLDHHYKYSTRLESYYRDKDYLADLVGFIVRKNDFVTFLHEFYDASPRELSILDLGCADGVMTQFALRGSDSICCADISRESLQKARRLFSLPRMPQPKLLAYVQCDASFLPFPNNSFDLIICTEVLEHVDNPLATLTGLWRILRDGGKLYLTTPNISGKGFLYGPLKRVTARYGMRLREHRSIYKQIENVERKYGASSHVKEFTVDELSQLLVESGFIERKIRTTYLTYSDLHLVSKFFGGMDRLISFPIIARMYAVMEGILSCLPAFDQKGSIQTCVVNKQKR